MKNKLRLGCHKRIIDATMKSTGNQSFIKMFSGVCVQQCMLMDVHVSVCLSLSVRLCVYQSGQSNILISLPELFSSKFVVVVVVNF